MEARTYSGTNGRVREADRWALPVLEARRGGPAERFAGRLSGRHPAAVFFAALLAGFTVLALISIALGVLVTDVLLDIGGLRNTDNSTVKSLVAERTPFLTDVSEVGSTIGGAPLLPILVGAIALVCAFLRKWLIAAFAVFVLVVESATYRVTSLAVPRDRPHVHRLEDLPADASYPVRSHGGGHRGLRGPRAAPDLPFPDPGAAHLRVGHSDRDPHLRGAARGCTAGCTTRLTPPRGWSSESERCSCCCSPRARQEWHSRHAARRRRSPPALRRRQPVA